MAIKCDCGQPVEVVYLEKFGTIYCHTDTGHFYCEKRLDHASVNGVNRPGGCAVRTVPLPEFKTKPGALMAKAISSLAPRGATANA